MLQRELWAGLVTVLGLFLFAFLRVCLRFHRYLSMLDALPGPKGYPIIGNLLLLNVHKTGVIPMIEGMLKFGPIARGRAFGVAHVIISDVNSIEKVLSSTRYIKKSTDYRFLKPWLQEGLLTSTGSKWHTRRKILTSAFHFKILGDYLPVFYRNSIILVEKLKEHIEKPFIKINSFITLCTLDIICETAMGTSINAQLGEEVEYVRSVQRISELFQLRQLTVRLYSDLLFKFSSMGREQAKVLGILHGFSNKIIKQRRAEYKAEVNDPTNTEGRVSKRKHLAFLDLLIEISEKEHTLTDRDIQEEVDTFMFEGHDTTTSAICWALYLLGKHPDIQERVVEELNGIFGDSDRSPTHDDLSSMKYLEQVIKETLRLYPSVPAFSRQLETDIELLGHTVPAGANISVLPLFLHRDPKLYPDPEKFDPDRFSVEACQNRHPYSYLPFSAGPRSCIGQRFALMEEKVVLSTVLRNFRLESLDKPEDITMLMELILRPMEELRIRFSPR
ncbi:cytochrome P450 4C1 isoform X1 [Anabrus simplex]|uniref:cytochrome P450 4C1 isoform X1 n=1 Tax=Anabrus simplex TaxID=316456 RepID=UPI0035A2F695